MMIGTPKASLCGSSTMFLAGTVLGMDANLLVDTGDTYNIINTNFARLIGLMEQHIRRTTLFGDWEEVTYQGVCS